MKILNQNIGCFSELEETLLLLPYSTACNILQRLPSLLKRDYHAELLARLALCLIQAYHGPIVANKNLLPILESVKTLAIEKISTLRVMNIYLLTFLTLFLKISCYLYNKQIQCPIKKSAETCESCRALIING